MCNLVYGLGYNHQASSAMLPAPSGASRSSRRRWHPVALTVDIQVGALGRILTQQPGVLLLGAAMPRAVLVTEIDPPPLGGRQLPVVAHLLASSVNATVHLADTGVELGGEGCHGRPRHSEAALRIGMGTPICSCFFKFGRQLARAVAPEVACRLTAPDAASRSFFASNYWRKQMGLPLPGRAVRSAAWLCAVWGTSGCSVLGSKGEIDIVVNSLGMQFVRIPAGEFAMGSERALHELQDVYVGTEPERLEDLSDERPLHQVQITRSFYMGRTEVTRGQFRTFVERSGYIPESIADGTGAYGYDPNYDPQATARGDAFAGRNPRYSWEYAGFVQDDSHPVVNVTWNDAQAMVRWLTQQERRRYRLPTEAEWEYACRGSGNPAPGSLQGQANVFDADTATLWPQWSQRAFPFRDGYVFTAPAGALAPNAFGLHDMVGNVWEWTADWYGQNYYDASPKNDPQGREQGDVRVRRGGSWHTWPLYARCSYRNWNTPETRYVLVGIRIVLEAP